MNDYLLTPQQIQNGTKYGRRTKSTTIRWLRSINFLEFTLYLTIAIHGLAMVTMVTLLMAGIPGGGSSMVTERATYIAQHPTLWRLGWLPWQITAFVNLLFAIALIRTSAISKRIALLIFFVTLVAISIEQPAELSWVTTGIDIAQQAVATGDMAAYADYEAHTFPYVSGWPALIYSLVAVGWTIAFYQTGLFGRKFLLLSTVTWGVLGATASGLLLPAPYKLPDSLISGGNALGFSLMMIWFVWVTEIILRSRRPNRTLGKYQPWHAPRRFMCLATISTNSRFLQTIGSWLPSLAYVSDIKDVVYANYLVKAADVEKMIPAPLQLQRIGSDDTYAMFTHLTYQHGHFGPRFLGRLRKWLPSPIQSNWRLYVTDPITGRQGVYFVTTAINNSFSAILARMLSHGVPMHTPESADIDLSERGELTVNLRPGETLSPDLTMRATLKSERQLPDLWQTVFPTYEAMLSYCVPQDIAISVQPWATQLTFQEIELNIDPATCQPLAGEVSSNMASQITNDADPVCFYVPEVDFLFETEKSIAF